MFKSNKMLKKAQKKLVLDLFMDTTGYGSVSFALGGGKTIRKTYQTDPHQSHEILQKLDEFLKFAKIKMVDIKKIVVNKGPGSFTGTRIGVTHAQALGFALNVPVKFFSADKFKTD